jgi:serpin B
MCGTKLDAPESAAHSEDMTSSRSALFPRNVRGLASIRNICGLGALLSAFGCNGGQTGDEQTGSVLQELRGTASRVATTGSLPNSAGADGWDFGWKFYAEERRPNENVFFSPYSISVASSMLVAGAAGQTKSEIDSALSFSNDDGPTFHQARNEVAQALERRNRPGNEQANAQALHVSNDLWLARDFSPTPTFLDTLSAYYGAGTFLAPFDTDPEGSRGAINRKVAQDTEQLIKELLPRDSISSDVQFVLTNALYFKSRWATEFSKSETKDEPFSTAAGPTSNVPMMHGFIEGRHFASPDYETIAMKYAGLELELVAIMPRAGTFDTFTAGLNAASVAQAESRLEAATLVLSFPKFGIESRVPLEARLRALGMQQAFEPSADFSALSSQPVYISDAFHQATLTLDEEGTEAAAATAFIGRPVSSGPPSVTVVFDHPFVFFIRDVQTNALLFVGHFAGP